MFRYKERFVCERCGRVFYEYVPDCIMPETAELLLHPKCKMCRFIGKIIKKQKKGEKL